MGKQNNFRLSKTKNNILYILSGATLALFAGLTLFPIINETTHAEGDEPEDGITVVTNNNIEINLLSTDQGYYKIAKDTVTVSTGSEYGYTLYLSTDSAAHQSIYLNGDTSSESKISGTTGTYESPAALADEGYSWGWAVPGISHFDNVYNTTNPDAKSKFAVMPLENKIIHEYTTEATEDTTDVYYGFKLEGTLEPGEYETAISYTAVSADAPLMARAILGDNGNLNFVYDRNTYTAGETYTDNIGETEITNVYEVPTDAYIIDTEEVFSTDYCPAWTVWPVAETIYSANFDSSFYGFKPTSTSCWFYSLENLASVTNANRLNTSDVTNMHSMFEQAGYSAATFSLDLSSWNTGNVTDMVWMFSGTGENATTWSIGNLSGWDTSSVTNMCGMFSYAGSNATSWDIGDLSGWDTGNVTNMNSMFFSAGESATTWGIGDVSEWDVAKVTDHTDFIYLNTYQSNISVVNNQPHWNRVAKAILGENGNLNFVYDNNDYVVGNTYTDNLGETTIANIYEVPMGDLECQVEFWDDGYTLSVVPDWVNYDNSYSITSANIEESFVDVRPASTCAWFGFSSIGTITGLENLNTSNVTNMSYMFAEPDYYDVATWNIGDISGLDMGNVTDASYMFYHAGVDAAAWNPGDLGGWDTSNIVNASYMFYRAGLNAATWSIGDLSGWNTSNMTNMSHMFSHAGENAAIWNVGDLSEWNIGNATNVSGMFSYAGFNATTFDIGDLSGWDTGNVTNMSSMFSAAGYSSATFDVGDLGGWDTGKVTDISWMFMHTGYNATTWNVGDIGGWDTSNVTEMHSVFNTAGYNATTFNMDLSGWDTGNVADMDGMFGDVGHNATTFNVDLSGWDIDNVIRMTGMFYNAGYNATTFDMDLSGWDTGNVADMFRMFYNAGYNATTFDVDLSGWDTSNVTNMSNMLYNAGYNATVWYIGDISGWNVGKAKMHSGFINLNAHQTNASVVNNQPNWPN